MDFTGFVIIIFLIFIMVVGMIVAKRLVKAEEEYSKTLEAQVRAYELMFKDLKRNMTTEKPYITKHEFNEIAGRNL